MKINSWNNSLDSMIVILLSLGLMVIVIYSVVAIVHSEKEIFNSRIKIFYYQKQMINFCKITELYNNETFPEMYPCEKWILQGDRK